MDDNKVQQDIQVIQLFHIATNTTFLVCRLHRAHHIALPGTWQLFKDNRYITDITLGGLVMGGNKPVDEAITIITFWVTGHLDKHWFDFEKMMLLKPVPAVGNPPVL